MTPKEKYKQDPLFHAMTCVIKQALTETSLTANDIKECIYIAQVLIEERKNFKIINKQKNQQL